MKRIFILIMVIAAFAIVSTINVKVNTENNELAIINLNNVEILAYGEDVSGSIQCKGSGKIYCYLTNTSEYNTVEIKEQ